MKRLLIIGSALLLAAMAAVSWAQSGPAFTPLSKGNLVVEGQGSPSVQFPWTTASSVDKNSPAMTPECTATNADTVFTGPLKNVITTLTPYTITSEFTVLAHQDELPASVHIQVWTRSTVTYTETAASGTSMVLNSVSANDTSFQVGMGFAVPEGAQQVVMGVRVELSCGEVVLSSKEQTFIWRSPTMLPMVVNDD